MTPSTMAKLVILPILVAFASPGFCAINLTMDATSICPQVTFTCSAIDLQDSTLRWFLDDAVIAVYAFSSDHQYPLSVPASNQTANEAVGRVNTTILSASAGSGALSIQSELTVNIAALQKGAVSFVECGSLFNLRSNISLRQINAPTSPSEILAIPSYENFKLVNITVKWKRVDSSIEFCVDDINYSVNLSSTAGSDIIHVDSSNCTGDNCSITLFPSSDQDYKISVASDNIFGQSSSTIFDGVVYGSAFNHSVTSEDCEITIVCSTILGDVGNCTIEYSQDHAIEDINMITNHSLNVPVKISLESSSTYFFRITYMKVFEYQNHTLGKISGHLTSTNTVLVATGVVIFIMAGVCILCVWLRMRYKKVDIPKEYLNCLTALNIIFIVSTAIVWIATSIVIGSQTSTCDSRSAQNSLVILVFCLSMACFIFAMIVLMVTLWKRKLNYKQILEEFNMETYIEELPDLPDPKEGKLFKYNSNPVIGKRGPRVVIRQFLDDDKLVPKSKSFFCQICKIDTVSTIPKRRTHCRSCGNLVCPSCSENKCIFKSEFNFFGSHNEVRNICDPCYHEICNCFLSHVLLFDEDQSNFKEKFMILTVRLGKIAIYSYCHQDLQTHNAVLTDPEFEIYFKDIRDVHIMEARPTILNCFEVVTDKKLRYCFSVATKSLCSAWIDSIRKISPYVSAEAAAKNPTSDDGICDKWNRLVLTGWLTTWRRGLMRHWEQYFMILTQKALYWYKSSEDVDYCHKVLLDQHFFAQKVDEETVSGMENVFKFKLCKGLPNTFFAQAASEEERCMWINTIMELRNQYEKQFEYPSVDDNENVVLSGIVKKSIDLKQEQFMVVTDEKIQFFATEKDIQPCESVLLASVDKAIKMKNKIELTLFEGQPIYFQPINLDDTNEWLQTISTILIPLVPSVIVDSHKCYDVAPAQKCAMSRRLSMSLPNHLHCLGSGERIASGIETSYLAGEYDDATLFKVKSKKFEIPKAQQNMYSCLKKSEMAENNNLEADVPMGNHYSTTNFDLGTKRKKASCVPDSLIQEEYSSVNLPSGCAVYDVASNSQFKVDPKRLFPPADSVCYSQLAPVRQDYDCTIRHKVNTCISSKRNNEALKYSQLSFQPLKND